MALNQALSRVVAGISYLVHPQVLARVVEDVAVFDIRPVVIVNALEAGNAVTDVLNQLEAFAKVDDVYSKAFAESVVVQFNSSAANTSVLGILKSSQRFSHVFHTDASSNEWLPSGPYFLCGGELHQAWRLYDDYLDSFIFAVIPDDVRNPKRYSVIDSLSSDGLWRRIAVPSRMYDQPTPQRPLAGARMGIKDIFQLAGVKTTMMSRAYTELYGPDAESADYIKKLIHLGAVIVGKTKMTSFASSEEPTDQWIDFHCPVNPRGDQYQSPSGSSSGAAAALAGYPWLDYSVAGDSAGSIRAPATCNGLFSLRPSFGKTSMKGISFNSQAFDVVGHFSRDLGHLHHIFAHTMDLDDSSTDFPKRILYPLDFFPHSNPKHQAMVDEFIGVLEKFLGVKKTEFSIAERWSQCPPKAANGRTLKDYLAKSAFWSLCYDYYHAFKQFRVDYEQKFAKKPFEGAIVNFRWGVGQNVTENEVHKYQEELQVFRDWFDENVMSSNQETLSDAIMVMPYGSANPKYRDRPNEAPSTSHTIGEKFISPALHLPQLVLPFAQMPYESRINGGLEYRPIASTLVGAKGSDLMLIKLAKAAFEHSAWPTRVSTGRLMYPVGENLRNVADADESKL